ncbi:ubiquitin-protein ligase, putative, partial [Entamoeba invadens IP1]
SGIHCSNTLFRGGFNVHAKQCSKKAIVLCAPYKLCYYNFFLEFYYNLGTSAENKEPVVNLLKEMNNTQLKTVQTSLHDCLYEMFNRGTSKSSNNYKHLLPMLRIYYELYELNLVRKYTSYTCFYLKSISIERNWSDDFRAFLEQREGLLSYPFCIELYTRVLVLHKENELDKKDAIRLEFERANTFFIKPFLELNVERENLLLTSMNGLLNRDPLDFKKELKIQFMGEPGVDQGGVSKEWFSLITKEIFNVDFGMFSYNKKTRYFWFSSCSEDIVDFELIGIVLGLAIYNDIILDISFPHILYKKLLGEPITFEDYKDFDPECYTSLVQLKEVAKTDDLSALGMYFETTKDVFGEIIDVDLIPNGRNVLVTNDNIDQYITAFTDYFCSSSIGKQFGAFRKGFLRVVTSPLILMMRPEELELVICGTKEFDFVALRESCEYKNYKKDSPVIQWFWEVVFDLDIEQKKQLLVFVTSNDRVPVGGLGNLRFFIDKYGEVDRYPTASTCFNALHLPPYPSKDILKEKLLFAIQNATGFGLA